MKTVINVKDVTKTYQEVQAIRGVSFEVKKGEIFGFLGPSGSGKTTTIKILTAQIRPTTGSVAVFGKEPAPSSEYMKRMGVLTDHSGLYERLSIEDNLLLFAGLYEVSRTRVEQVLIDVNLKDEKKKAIKHLSKGMKQRVLIARVLLHQPELLFLDEPTSSLDPSNQKYIHQALKELNRAGTTIFLTTHDMLEAEGLCDRIAFLNGGKIVALDTPENLRIQHGNQTITVRLMNGDKKLVACDEQGAAQIYHYLKQGQMQTIHSNEPTLGDIFIKLTGRGL
ncbi:ABC-2 type transport system ATP-binding protein [Seinonella peptonophila]|uniref:ABC-2 type transport system ATP-binding protein n=1 Tax=Seinonella peptonophila TaxID=112248 RepID=A0A1M4WGR7_9BACL|nr:ABC transporter ATP-binding protein [Seinonella peptonophila]SHE80426.1 ABC-2 type transport system ATP-binding protein [Seinonella peptonophila]